LLFLSVGLYNIR